MPAIRVGTIVLPITAVFQKLPVEAWLPTWARLLEFDPSKLHEANPLERAAGPLKGGMLSEILCEMRRCDYLTNTIESLKISKGSINRWNLHTFLSGPDRR